MADTLAAIVDLQHEIEDLRRQLAAAKVEISRLTPEFSGKPDEPPLHKIKAKCTQLWNEPGMFGAAEVHCMLERIYEWACEAERDLADAPEALGRR